MPQYYLVAVNNDASTRTRSEAESAPMYEAVGAVNQRAVDDGIFIFAGGLEDQSASTTINPSSGTAVLTDGPYVETKEFMGGLWIIEMDDLEAAAAWAQTASVACGEVLEVRPFMPGSESRPADHPSTGMPQYLFAVFPDEHGASRSPEEMAPLYEAVGALNQQAMDDGVFVFAGGLEAQTTTVDPSSGTPVLSDGPYLETKERIGGLSIIEAPNFDTALAWATAGSLACEGIAELRPFMTMPSAAD